MSSKGFFTSVRRALGLAVASCSLVAALGTAALASQNDGALPIYPRAPIVTGGRPIPAAAYSRGFMGIGQTSDAPHVVIAWYRAHLPPAYKVVASNGGTHFKGPGGVVNVVTFKGYTRVALVPTPPQLPTCVTNLYPQQLTNCAAPATVPKKRR